MVLLNWSRTKSWESWAWARSSTLSTLTHNWPHRLRHKNIRQPDQLWSLQKFQSICWTTWTKSNKCKGNHKALCWDSQTGDKRVWGEEEHTWVAWGPCEWEPLVSCHGDRPRPGNTENTSSWHGKQCNRGGVQHHAALWTREHSHNHNHHHHRQ